MTSVIAEIGWNHMGDMSLAEEMISQASESGAKFAKFQTWSVKRLKNGEWDNDGRRQIYEKAELSIEDHELLINLCEKHKINFLSSCFSLEDAKLLKGLNQKEIKIPSFEVRNVDLLKFCFSNFEHVFVSTGTANQLDLNNLKELIKNHSATVMHCVSSYPCNVENANLPRIASLSEMFEDVGYSDHVGGIDASIAALEYMPSFIEKHFTIDNDLPGRDNKFAILPDDFATISKYRDSYLKMNLDKGLDLQECEKDIYNNYRGRWSK